MTTSRKPAAFRLQPPPGLQEKRAEPKPAPAETRRPRAVAPAEVLAVADAVDVFDHPEDLAALPPPANPPKRRSHLGSVFAGALGVLISLTAGIWVDRLIRALFERAPWLGYVAAAAAAVAALALLAILIREAVGLMKLASVERLRSDAAAALARNDRRAASAVVDRLATLLAARPETAAGRAGVAALRDDIIDGADLIRLAEAELLSPLDARAKTIILDAAKRVSLVTAVSPRALVDIGYVVFEAGRLIRRLATLYGARPGALGFLRLVRSVLAHLAVTGSIAVGDSFVQQIVGHGLAARLSAKLGEGVVNGMMTARIGIAALDTVRPLPFTALKRPGLADFLAALTTFARARQAGPEDLD